MLASVAQNVIRETIEPPRPPSANIGPETDLQGTATPAPNLVQETIERQRSASSTSSLSSVPPSIASTDDDHSRFSASPLPPESEEDEGELIVELGQIAGLKKSQHITPPKPKYVHKNLTQAELRRRITTLQTSLNTKQKALAKAKRVAEDAREEYSDFGESILLQVKSILEVNRGEEEEWTAEAATSQATGFAKLGVLVSDALRYKLAKPLAAERDIEEAIEEVEDEIESLKGLVKAKS